MSTTDFNESVKELFLVKARLKALTDSVKNERMNLKRRADELQETVKTFMISNEIDVVNYQTTKLSIATVKKQNTLTKAKLKDALMAMSNDNITAEKQFEFIMEHVGGSESKILRQTKVRKPATESQQQPPPRPPRRMQQQQMIERPPYHDDEDDDDDN